MTDIKSLTLEELKTEMERLGEKSFRAAQLYQWMHQKLARSFDGMTNLPAALRKKLAQEYAFTAIFSSKRGINASIICLTCTTQYSLPFPWIWALLPYGRSHLHILILAYYAKICHYGFCGRHHRSSSLPPRNGPWRKPS